MCSGPKALGPDVSVCKRELQASSWTLVLSTPQPSLKILPCSTQESTLPDFWLFVPVTRSKRMQDEAKQLKQPNNRNAKAEKVTEGG